MYLPHEEEAAKKMIHITIARTVVGAAVRTAVRYGPTAYRFHKATKFTRQRKSVTKYGLQGDKRNSFVYQPTYAPEEKWWE